jgi:sulfatase maturation enzyme AslB (radical SAM superfamily)
MIIAVYSAIDASITTNATIMNDRVRRVLEKVRPTISVSCDSLDKKTYESIRVNAKYETFFENLMIFRDSARVSQKALALSVCPMQNNWKTIPDILRFCNESAACIGFNTMVWPLDLSIQTLPKPEITKVVKFLEAECSPDFKTDSRWWVRHNYGVYQSMLNQLKFWASDETKEVYV